MEGLLHAWTRHGNADAGKVGDDLQQGQKPEHAMAVFRSFASPEGQDDNLTQTIGHSR
jgi:hypothetical protein